MRLHLAELVEGPADDVFGTILASYPDDVHLKKRIVEADCRLGFAVYMYIPYKLVLAARLI